ncbi:MAG TPA: pyridoxal-phosphate dependent enzyme [Gemmatimonadales bacterium]|nr:pyridoxal-phosphate dependent enzyme [Gemmatimonadales bacterium]
MDAAALAHKIRATLAPRCLGAWPTPLEAAPGLARAARVDALWLKREDRAGGNKVRGLEFLLAGAAAGTVFVTVGGTGSTHCLATARQARALGYRTALAQFPQPATDAGGAVAAATAAAADLVIRAGSGVGLPVALARAWFGARRLGAPRWIPGGGAHPRAVVGHLLAALELATQLDAPPDGIVLPLGTGGTAAGIALGVACLGWPTRVIAVRVAPRLVANRWRISRLARGAARLLETRDAQLRTPHSALRFDVVDGLGAGYGHPSPAGERARALAADHGLTLDPTYGAKAFAVLVERAAGNLQRVVFWHTFAWP